MSVQFDPARQPPSQEVSQDQVVLAFLQTAIEVNKIFTCASCGREFTSLKNLLAHHWCISEEEVIERAKLSNLEYEREMVFQRKLQPVELPPIDWDLLSPPIVIISSRQVLK